MIKKAALFFLLLTGCSETDFGNEFSRNNPPPDKPADAISEHRTVSQLVIEKTPLGSQSNCDDVASTLATALVVKFQIELIDSVGIISRNSDTDCHIVIDYRSAQALKVIRQGESLSGGRYWDDPWDFATIEECEANRSEQRDLFAEQMEALVLSDSCRLRSQYGAHNGLGYSIEGVSFDTPKKKVVSYSNPIDLPLVWEKIERNIVEANGVVFRDSLQEARHFAAYVPVDSPMLNFQYLSGVSFSTRQHCEETGTAIKSLLTIRYGSEVYDIICDGQTNYRVNVHYLSDGMRTFGPAMQSYPQSWFTTFDECMAKVTERNKTDTSGLFICNEINESVKRFFVFEIPVH